MFNIYLSGGITGMSYEEISKFREYVSTNILNDFNLNYDTYKVKPVLFNPVIYFNYHNKNDFKSERQVLKFELNALRKSDLVIVNFNAPKSLGTMSELAIAYEHKIPIVGYKDDKIELHPWIEEFTDVIFTDIDEMVNYVKEYYLYA